MWNSSGSGAARHGLGGKAPKMSFSPRHRETHWSTIRRWIGQKFWPFLQSKSVNNVRKLLQLLGGVLRTLYWGFAPELTGWLPSARPSWVYNQWKFLVLPISNRNSDIPAIFYEDGLPFPTCHKSTNPYPTNPTNHKPDPTTASIDTESPFTEIIFINSGLNSDSVNSFTNQQPSSLPAKLSAEWLEDVAGTVVHAVVLTGTQRLVSHFCFNNSGYSYVHKCSFSNKEETIHFLMCCSLPGGVAAVLVGHWNYDLRVMDSSPGWAPSHTCLGQATYTSVPLSPSSIIWYQPRSGYILWLGR